MKNPNNQLNLFDQEPEHKPDSRSAFIVTGLIGLGAAAAIGVGFVLGGGGGARKTEVAGAAVVATGTRSLPVSPTAPPPQPQGGTQGSQTGGQASGAAGAGNAGSGNGAASNGGGGTQASSNAGDTSGYQGEPTTAAPTHTPIVPAPTNTPAPPAPTNTPVPPTSTATTTPVPPTNTPTATPTATATPGGPFIPICIPCLDPVIIIDLDFVPPVFTSTYRANCFANTVLEFTVNEHSEMWATYTVIGLFFETDHTTGLGFAANIPTLFFTPDDVVFHATDDHGNAATIAPVLSPC